MQNQPSFARPDHLLPASCVRPVRLLWRIPSVIPASLGDIRVFIPFSRPEFVLVCRGPNVAASTIYNTAHSYVGPGLAVILAVPLHSVLFGELSIIWIAPHRHGRALGYGLKYPASFRFTHIQSAANPMIEPTLPRAKDE